MIQIRTRISAQSVLKHALLVKAQVIKCVRVAMIKMLKLKRLVNAHASQLSKI